MFEIDKNIPIPMSDRIDGNAKYPFGSMEVGDSFAIQNDKRTSVRLAARSWVLRRSLSWKFAVRLDTTGQLRCWRIE